MNNIIETIERQQMKDGQPTFRPGDALRIHVRIVEGDKERIQVFSGTVIMKKGRGINETFTVRRIVNNEGVERIFPLHSPFIAKVVVRRGGETRRAKLFYLRDRVGKSVKLTEKQRPGGAAGKKEGGDGQSNAPTEKPGAAAKRELAAAAS